MLCFITISCFLFGCASACNIKSLKIVPDKLSLGSKESSYIEIQPDVSCEKKLYIDKSTDKIERLDKTYRLSSSKKFKIKIKAKEITEELNEEIRVKVGKLTKTFSILLLPSPQLLFNFDITSPYKHQEFFENEQILIQLTIFGKTTKETQFDVYLDDKLQTGVSLSIPKGKTKLSSSISLTYDLPQIQNNKTLKLKPKDDKRFDPSSKEVSITILRALPFISISPQSIQIYNSAFTHISFSISSKYEIELTENVKVRIVEPLDICLYFTELNNNEIIKEFIIDKDTVKKEITLHVKENCKKKHTTVKFGYFDEKANKEVSKDPVELDIEVKEQSLIKLSAVYNIPESLISFNKSYTITISLNQKMTQDNSSCDTITLEPFSSSDILSFEPSSLTFNCITTSIVQDLKVQLYSVDIKKDMTEVYYELTSENKLIENLPSKSFLIDIESLSGMGKIKMSYKKKKKIMDSTKITFKLTKCPIVFGNMETLRIKIVPDEDSEDILDIKNYYVEWAGGKDCSNYGMSKNIKVEGKQAGTVEFEVVLEGSAKNKYSYKQSFKMEFYVKKEEGKEIEIEVDDFDDDTLVTAKGQKIKLEIDKEPEEDLYIEIKYDKDELVVVPDVIKFEDDEDEDVYFNVYSISEETEHSTISFEVKNEDDFDDDDEDTIEVPDNLKLKICGIKDYIDLSQNNDGGDESTVGDDNEETVENNIVVDKTFVVGVVIVILLIISILLVYFVF